MFCHIHISRTHLSARIDRAMSHPCPWDLSYLLISPYCPCCHHFCLWCSPFPQATPVNKMAAASVCSGIPGTQAFAAQPDTSPALAVQGKHVSMTNSVKIKLEKNPAGLWSCNWFIFSLYLALSISSQFFILLVSGSSSVIILLESFMDFFFSHSVWTTCHLMVQRNEGQMMLGGGKVDLKVVHPTNFN